MHQLNEPGVCACCIDSPKVQGENSIKDLVRFLCARGTWRHVNELFYILHFKNMKIKKYMEYKRPKGQKNVSHHSRFGGVCQKLRAYLIVEQGDLTPNLFREAEVFTASVTTQKSSSPGCGFQDQFEELEDITIWLRDG